MDHREVRHVPMRTCVGCRGRAAQSDLLRVVAVEVEPGQPPVLVPDGRGRAPGRGAYLHHDPGCLDLAERRRAFPRALRRGGPLDTSLVRAEVLGRRRDHDVSPRRGAGPREGDRP